MYAEPIRVAALIEALKNAPEDAHVWLQIGEERVELHYGEVNLNLTTKTVYLGKSE